MCNCKNSIGSAWWKVICFPISVDFKCDWASPSVQGVPIFYQKFFQLLILFITISSFSLVFITGNEDNVMAHHNREHQDRQHERVQWDLLLPLKQQYNHLVHILIPKSADLCVYKSHFKEGSEGWGLARDSYLEQYWTLQRSWLCVSSVTVELSMVSGMLSER